MIFNCPNCDKKYLLSASALGVEGKMVRCVNCAYEWFQEPERNVEDFNPPKEEELEAPELEEEESFDSLPPEEEDEEDQVFEDEKLEEDSIESVIEEIAKEIEPEQQDGLDIPKGVQPRQEETTAAPPKKEKKVKPPPVEEPLADRMMGYGAALSIFFLILMAAIFMKSPITSAWPPSVAIYDLAGLSTKVPGEGLLIDTLSAKLQEDKKIILQGSVLNVANKEISVPSMRVIFKLDDAGTDNQWIIEPPVKILAAGDNFSFTSLYENPPEDLSIVNISFMSES